MAKLNLNPATFYGAAHGSELFKLAWRGLAIVVGVAALTASAKFSISFIYGDLLKIGIAALLVHGVWRLQLSSGIDGDRSHLE